MNTQNLCYHKLFLMKNILVPTDFSIVSTNAATYAIELAKSLNYQKIIYYNVYQAPVLTEPTIPAMQVIDFDSLKKISENGLKKIKDDQEHLGEGKVEFECISEFGVLDSSITDVCERTGCDIIVMGILGGNNIEEVLIGSSATSVAHHTKFPVIIVPPQAVFRPITQIVMACDFKKVGSNTPVNAIMKLLDTTGAHLSILHVDEHKKEPADFDHQKELLNELFKDYQPQFFFIQNEDFAEGINDFVTDHQIDLVITIPKKHGLFDRLFKRSHTKHLAFHTNIPLMCIHEEV